jgi:hypothetical protein
MTEQEKEMVFPITHDKCPCCGSTRRVADMVKDQEVAKGKIRSDSNFALSVYIAAISDPRIATLTSPVITSMIDVCSNCGCVWSPMTQCVEQETTKMQLDNSPYRKRPPQPPLGAG